MNEKPRKEEMLEDVEYQRQLIALRKEIQKGLDSGEAILIEDIPAFFEQIKASAKFMG